MLDFLQAHYAIDYEVWSTVATLLLLVALMALVLVNWRRRVAWRLHTRSSLESRGREAVYRTQNADAIYRHITAERRAADAEGRYTEYVNAVERNRKKRRSPPRARDYLPAQELHIPDWAASRLPSQQDGAADDPEEPADLLLVPPPRGRVVHPARSAGFRLVDLPPAERPL